MASPTTLDNAATWHATMALKAYRRKDWETYTRHIKIADGLRLPRRMWEES